MQKYKYLIIGGGIAGTTAAETIRKEDKEGSLAIVSDEPYRLYSRIMLSKLPYFLGKVPKDAIWMKKETWYSENKIDFLGGKKAVTVDSQNKIVKLESGEEIQYEKLLLVLGACARPWSAKNADKTGVHYVRTYDQGTGLIAQTETAKHAVMIGGGFISFEVADLLREKGIEVTLILRESYFWEPILDQASGLIVEDAATKKGVKIIKNMEVEEVLGSDKVAGVKLKDGSEISCDMIVCGIGVMCSLDWLKVLGLEVGHGIFANEYLETNLPDVWTAGDVAEFNDVILGERVQLGNWQNAMEQGRVAGLNMLGKKQIFKKVTSYVTHGFGIAIGFVGDVRAGENKKIIKRGSQESGKCAQLVILNDEIVGATTVNNIKEMQQILKLIEGNVKVAGKEAELADPGFDLATLG